jgi:hypothetical protein
MIPNMATSSFLIFANTVDTYFGALKIILKIE